MRLDQSDEHAPSLNEFLLQAWARRREGAFMFTGVLLLSLLIAAIVPARYRATATLAILPAPEFTVRPAAGSREQAANPLAMDQIMKAETEILGSDDLHLATLQRLGPEALYPGSGIRGRRHGLRKMAHLVLHALASPWMPAVKDKAAQAIEGQLRRFAHDLLVLPAKDSNIITVTYSNHDPALAAGAVNSMLSLYAERRRILYDDPQLATVRRETAALTLASAEADTALAAFKRAHAISDFEAQRSLLLTRKSAADQALGDTALAVADQRTRMEILDRQLSREPPTIGVFTEQDRDTRAQTAETALQDLRARLAGASDRYRDGSRLISQLHAQVAAREEELHRITHAPSASIIRQGRNPNLDLLRLDRLRVQSGLAAAVSRQQTLGKQRAELAQALVDCEANDATLLSLQRQKLVADENLRSASRLVSERHLTEAEDALRLANVRVIQPARVPQTAVPLPFLIVAAGSVFGVAAAALWLLGRFMSQAVVVTEEGLGRALELPVLASFCVLHDADQEAALVS